MTQLRCPPAGQTSYTHFWLSGVPSGASVSVIVNCLMARETTLVWGNRLNSLELTQCFFLVVHFQFSPEPTLFVWLLSPQESFLLLLLKKRGKLLKTSCPFYYCGKIRLFPHKFDRVLCLVLFGVLMKLAELRAVRVTMWTPQVVHKKSSETTSGSSYFLFCHFSASFLLPLSSRSLILASESLPIVTLVFLFTFT